MFVSTQIRTSVLIPSTNEISLHQSKEENMAKDRLSKRQLDIYNFICKYTDEHGFPPSVR